MIPYTTKLITTAVLGLILAPSVFAADRIEIIDPSRIVTVENTFQDVNADGTLGPVMDVDQEMAQIGSEETLQIDSNRLDIQNPDDAVFFGARDQKTGAMLFFDAYAAESAVSMIDQIVTIGERVWRLVQEGRPVVQNKPAMASAVPRNVEHWSQLESWKLPRARIYRRLYKNGFGGTTVDFSFRVTYTWGGSLAKHGQYLANVSIVPSKLWVGFGRNFNSSVEIRDAVNRGTAARPVAGLEVVLSSDASTWMNYSSSSDSFFILGTGQISSLTQKAN